MLELQEWHDIAMINLYQPQIEAWTPNHLLGFSDAFDVRHILQLGAVHAHGRSDPLEKKKESTQNLFR